MVARTRLSVTLYEVPVLLIYGTRFEVVKDQLIILCLFHWCVFFNALTHFLVYGCTSFTQLLKKKTD